MTPLPILTAYCNIKKKQPTIHFPMKVENDNSITFHDTSVTRDAESLLITSMYRKPTHTDQYLALITLSR